ncbi:hypothetical protein ACFL16_01815 [Patescibacteria group bacterium]
MKKILTIAGVSVVLVAVGVFLVVWIFGGRSASRLGGKSLRQVIKIEGMKKIIGPVSFDRRCSSTVKNVTFLSEDGYVYTLEFKDVSPFGGGIRWVPYGEGDSFIQSRDISRWTGMFVELELPEDCAEILGVDISRASEEETGSSSKGNDKGKVNSECTGEGERVKNLTYRSSDGSIYSKEYREGMIDRHMGGWTEVKAK